jgi:ABC-type multidrug transport system permease subunit
VRALLSVLAALLVLVEAGASVACFLAGSWLLGGVLAAVVVLLGAILVASVAGSRPRTPPVAGYVEREQSLW